MHIIETLAGGPELVEWFGYIPTFHDAEILSLHLNREGTSRLIIQPYHVLSGETVSGAYPEPVQVIVVFTLEGVVDLELAGFNHQNVIYGLKIREAPNGYQLTLEDCFGLAGTISATRISLAFAVEG